MFQRKQKEKASSLFVGLTILHCAIVVTVWKPRSAILYFYLRYLPSLNGIGHSER